MANLYLTKEYIGEEAFNIIKENLKNPKVINVVNNMNSFDVFTDWGKFNFAVQGNRVKVTQGWNKDKMAFLIMLMVVGLIVWIPFIVLMVLVYLEYKNMKEIEQEVVNILNKN